MGGTVANDPAGDERRPVPTTTRRDVLRAGLGLAASAPLAGLLAACATGKPSVQSTATPTATATATVVPTATPDTRPITLAITGDVMLGRSLNLQILQSGDRFPFNDTADYLSTFDLTIGNLECVISTLGSPEPKEFTFPVDPAAFPRLTAAGFDIMSVANNHSGDMGKDAFVDMLGNLPAHGVTPLGGGRNLAEAHAGVVRRVRTTTVGLLAYCEIGPQNFEAETNSPGSAWLDLAPMQADITRLRPQVDFLIVFTHWGIEYVTQENDDQIGLAHAAIDAGADFVVGAHPHVRQPSETYRSKPIVYSLGNFVFDEMPGPEESQGSVLSLSLQGSQLLDWKLRTARIGFSGAPVWE